MKPDDLVRSAVDLSASVWLNPVSHVRLGHVERFALLVSTCSVECEPHGVHALVIAGSVIGWVPVSALAVYK